MGSRSFSPALPISRTFARPEQNSPWTPGSRARSVASATTAAEAHLCRRMRPQSLFDANHGRVLLHEFGRPPRTIGPVDEGLELSILRLQPIELGLELDGLPADLAVPGLERGVVGLEQPIPTFRLRQGVSEPRILGVETFGPPLGLVDELLAPRALLVPGLRAEPSTPSSPCLGSWNLHQMEPCIRDDRGDRDGGIEPPRPAPDRRRPALACSR